MEIMIARHAEDLGAEMEEKNRKLTPKGIKQANQLGTIILKFNPECIITSTLRRAKETIEYSKVPNDIIIIQQSLFNEQQMGSDKSENLNNGYVKGEMSYQGGETYDELRLRAEKAWEWLLNFSKKKGYTKIVVISHGRIITFLFAIILGFIPNGFNLQIENTSYFVFKVNEKWRPQLIASNLLNSH